MKYNRVTLNPSSRAYMRQVLSEGGTLARKIAELRDLSAGAVTADLPATLKPSAITNYSRANGTSRVPSLSTLIQLVSTFLASRSHGICVFENRYSRRSDPGTLSFRSKTLNFGEEIYHVVDKSSKEMIETAIMEADTAMLLVGVCADSLDANRLSSKSEVSALELRRLAEEAKWIIVEGFDGGGFLIWSAGHDGNGNVA